MPENVLAIVRTLVLVAVLSTVAACSPAIIPAGPTTRAPEIASGALITRDDERLPLTLWRARENARAIVIALHSFRDYRKAYDELGGWFAARGVSVYAYDQRGFGGAPNRGLWARAATMADDLRDAIAVVREENREVPIYLAGESMGAAVIMTLLGEPDPPDVAGIILAGPALRGKRVRSAMGDALLSLAMLTVPGNKSRVSQRSDPTLSRAAVVRLRDDSLVLRDARVDTYAGLLALSDAASAAALRIDVPTLLLLGANDRSVTLAAVCNARSHMRSQLGPRLITIYYRRGPHLVLQMSDNKRAFTDIAAWMSERTTPSLADSAFASDLGGVCRSPGVRR